MGVYGVVGHPVKEPYSAAMFEAAFYEYNMEDEWESFDIKPGDLRSFLKEVKEKGAGGLIVAPPFKESIVPMLNSLDVNSKAIGAVNAIVNVSGKWKGVNTEWQGAVKALDDAGSLEGKNVVIIGAGCTAAAISYGCKKEGANVIILNRGLDKAAETARKFNVDAGRLEDIMKFRAHVLINTMAASGPDQSLVPKEFYKKSMVVMDIHKGAEESQLEKEARRAECRIVPAYKMALFQAEGQFEAWFKKKPRTDKMEEALLGVL